MSRDLIDQYCYKRVTFIYSYCGRIRSIIRCTVRLPNSLVKVNVCTKGYLCMLLHCTLVSSSSATPTTSSSRAAPTPTTSSRELPPPPAAAELPERKQYRRGHRTTTTTQRYVMACCIALALKSYRKMCMQYVYSTHVRDLPFTSHVKHAW